MKEKENQMISLKREYGLSVADLLLLRDGLNNLGREADWDEKFGILASFGVEQACWKYQDTIPHLIHIEKDLAQKLSKYPICVEVVKEETRIADVLERGLIIGRGERSGD